MYLENNLLKAVRKRYIAQDKCDREIARICKHMDEAADRLVAERDALSDRLSWVYEAALKYNKLHTESQDKLRQSVERVRELKVELLRIKANVANRSF